MSQQQAHARAAAAARPRRTVTITGRPERAGRAPVRDAGHGGTVVPLPVRGRPASTRSRRIVELERRRPPRRPVERLGPNPDRLAMWAVVMALFLIVVTVLSAHGG
jgi:hypothetical protein